MNRNLDLFRTTCKVLRIPKAIERIWSRQSLMPWFRAKMISWMYERAKRHMSRNTEAYQSFQLDIGPGAYKRAFLTHRNAVTTAVKRVAGAPCVTETEKRGVLRADVERNVSLCLHNSFCRNREQKVSVDLLPCCKPRLLEQESWGTARNSMYVLEKVLEDSETEEQEQEAMERGRWNEKDVTRKKSRERRRKTWLSLCVKTDTNQLRLIIETFKLFVL